MKQLSLILVVAIALISCNKEDNPDTGNVDPEVYEIYKTLLMPLSSIQLIVSETAPNLNCASLPANYYDTLGVAQAEIDQCKAVNANAYQLSPEAMSNIHTLISPEELEELGWIEALEKYSAAGITNFGYPHFYDNDSKAIFELSYFCGGLCGSNEIIVMEKTNGAWFKKHSVITSISK